MRIPSVRSLLCSNVLALLWCSTTNGFVAVPGTPNYRAHHMNQCVSTLAAATTGEASSKTVRVGHLLRDLPTPSLILELSLMEQYVEHVDATLTVDDVLQNPFRVLQGHAETSRFSDDCGGALFVHTAVTSTEDRDAAVQVHGSGSCLEICHVDTLPAYLSPGGAYLGLGLANHHVGGYYWARSMGIGASLPAHGVCYGGITIDNTHDKSSNDNQHGRLRWKKRGPGLDVSAPTEESSNSNDGKRSEWVDFLSVGDTIQLVPNDPLAVLESSHFPVLIGMRRAGRPLGADPIVERVWYRTETSSGNQWKLWASQED